MIWMKVFLNCNRTFASELNCKKNQNFEWRYFQLIAMLCIWSIGEGALLLKLQWIENILIKICTKVESDSRTEMDAGIWNWLMV